MASEVAYINKNMLKWARSETPFADAPEVIASRLNISIERFLSWEDEASDEYPSLARAKEIAKIYKMPVVAFYLAAPPSRKPVPYQDRRTFNSDSAGKLSPELYSEINRVISEREAILDYSLLLSENKIFPEISDSIDIAADIIRSFFGIHTPFRFKNEYKRNPFSYFRKIIEQNGIAVFQLYGVNLSEMRGLAISYDDLPIICINSCDSNNAKVFTLFHELAHILRRTSSLCLVDFTDKGEEHICNEIAASVLMPRLIFSEVAQQRAVIDDDFISELSDHFAVSRLAVVVRLYNLGLISREEYRGFYAKYSFEPRKKTTGGGPSFIDGYLSKHGTLYVKTIFDAYENNLISFGESCLELGIKSKWFEGLRKKIYV